MGGMSSLIITLYAILQVSYILEINFNTAPSIDNAKGLNVSALHIIFNCGTLNACYDRCVF